MAEQVKEILRQRSSDHGSYKSFADMIVQFQGVIQNAPGYQSMDSVKRVSLDMVFMKIARLCNGNPNHLDSWMDIAGYVQLVIDAIEENIPSNQVEKQEK